MEKSRPQINDFSAVAASESGTAPDYEALALQYFLLATRLAAQVAGAKSASEISVSNNQTEPPTADIAQDHLDLEAGQYGALGTDMSGLTEEDSLLGMWELDFKSWEVAIQDFWAIQTTDSGQRHVLDFRSWVNLVHPEDFPEMEREINRHVRGLTPFCNLEFRVWRSADWRWVSAKGKITASSDAANPLKMNGVLEDITVYKETMLELEKKSRELSRSNAELQDFAYVASHDLQEPLRKISSFTEMFVRKYRGRLDDKADQYLHYIVDGARRMQNMINDLLEYSRVDRRELTSGVVDCKAVADHVVAMLGGEIEKAGARVEVDRLPSIRGNAVQITQLFQNLLSNAIKFRSDAIPHIRVSSVRHSDYWKISVVDNGIGFDDNYREQIFAIFSRLHDKDKYAGSGIGLAICKKIVERHGGCIGAESNDQSGSHFWFTVPAINGKQDTALNENKIATEHSNG